MFSGIGGFELGIQRACNQSANEISGQTEPNENLLQVRVGETIPALSRNDSGIGNVDKEQRSILSTDNGRLRSVCVGYSEIDKYAIQTYERHYGHTNYGDATRIEPAELPDFDLLVGGFPCQAFSIAGKRKGFDDTRGTLFFDIARILAEKRPRHLVLENVKGLLSHQDGETIQTILGILTDLGYRFEYQVLNSKDFGVPQNRERIYIIGHLRGECSGEVFPIGNTHRQTTKPVQGHYTNTLTARYEGAQATGSYIIESELNAQEIVQVNQPRHSNDRVYSDEGISPTLNTMQGGNRQPFVSTRWQRTEKGKAFRREAQKNGKDLTPFNDGYRELKPVPNKPVGAITSQAIAKDSLLSDYSRIRRLTPLECERLQGFPDNWTAGESDTQRYKMCGNAVTVNVVQAVITNLIKHMED
jgi:DNA (cytosine-5)-methyltransferase 1